MVKTIPIVVYVICIFLWSKVIWGNWAERVYEKNKDNQLTWYWLRLFKVAQTKENCIKFLKIISWAGIIIITLFTILIFLRKQYPQNQAMARSSVEFSENTTQMRTQILHYIPLDYSVDNARSKMIGMGCKCELLRGNKVVNETKDADTLWCDKRSSGLVIRRWQILFKLDENKKIKDSVVTTGLVGP